jgi:asparagine synthetase B (glutamine-hydrolysing)
VGVGDIGVLFSGGLDCSVLAFLICQNLPSHSQVFLLNVSFEENSPDRLTALKSFEELKKLHRLTRIVLVLIDVSQAEVSEEKERIIRLISSNDSRMDFSIATALFFASRGKGRDSDTGLPVEFNGKILMSGTGADEVFGGYSRYKSSFKHYGQEGVVREMSLDLDRLWHRNMGRDDRIVSCHARELRFPYLDSDFWLSLKNFSLDEVTRVDCPGNEKLLLRNYAKSLGFKETAQFPKRAIQFGTRISQVSNRQDFGSNRKAKGWQSMNKSKNQQISEEVEFCVKALEEKNRDQGEIERIAEVILRLRDPDVSVNDKRHLMRVYLGDYVSSIQHSNELED